MFGSKKRRAAREREEDNLKRRAAAIEFLERAERGELGHNESFHGEHRHSFDLLSKEERRRWNVAENAAENRMEQERNYRHAVRAATQSREHYEQATRGTLEEVTNLHSLLSWYSSYQVTLVDRQEQFEQEVGITRAEVFELLKQSVQAHYDRLMAERENPERFAELWILIERTLRIRNHRGSWQDSDLRLDGISSLAYPDDWNDLVARHYETPGLESFLDQPDRGSGQVRLLAAEALAKDDLALAQIALAYCNRDPECRAAVGDVLTAELAKLVHAHRAQFASAEQAETTS